MQNKLDGQKWPEATRSGLVCVQEKSCGKFPKILDFLIPPEIPVISSATRPFTGRHGNAREASRGSEGANWGCEGWEGRAGSRERGESTGLGKENQVTVITVRGVGQGGHGGQDEQLGDGGGVAVAAETDILRKAWHTHFGANLPFHAAPHPWLLGLQDQEELEQVGPPDHHPHWKPDHHPHWKPQQNGTSCG